MFKMYNFFTSFILISNIHVFLDFKEYKYKNIILNSIWVIVQAQNLLNARNLIVKSEITF